MKPDSHQSNADFHPKIQIAHTLVNFVRQARMRDTDGSPQFNAVIWNRWGAHGQENEKRERVRDALTAYWGKWNSEDKYAVLSQSNLEVLKPELVSGMDVELANAPALREEFTNMARAFELITWTKRPTLSLIPNSNNPMPTKKVRAEPVILCEWFSHHGYDLYPDKDEQVFHIQSGNWVYVTPNTGIDIRDKNFSGDRAKRLTVIMEPGPEFI